MPIHSGHRKPTLLVVLVSSILLLTAVLLAAVPVSNTQTPQQVADTLDSIVQPRFQQNAGRFGVDRIYFPGHDNTYELAGETTAERRKFRLVNTAHRPYVIAFLHCAHRPGQYLNSSVRENGDVHPYIVPLASVTATAAGSEQLWEWAGDNLGKAVLPMLPQLRQGHGVDKDFGNWRVVMRPVRASREACLSCHAGAKRGDTLGVMVYAVDKNAIQSTLHATIEGKP